MKVGLIDVDGHGGFPNLALMKLSAWHKAQRDSVEWWNGFERYDRVYMSKVFTFTPDFDAVIHADEIVTGGTGYKDYGSLPPEIEKTFPDYSIYPKFKQAIGFLTRGCIRNCPWCIVTKKEGAIHAAATWREIKRPDSREIIFMDNNVLACDHGLEQIEDMGGQSVWVDFNQALDARLITPEIARMLARLHWVRYVRLAEAGVSSSRFWAYALVQDVEEAHSRVLALQKMGVTPFAQPYRDFDGGEPTEEQKVFARWVNRKEIFKSCSLEDFEPWKKLKGVDKAV